MYNKHIRHSLVAFYCTHYHMRQGVYQWLNTHYNNRQFTWNTSTYCLATLWSRSCPSVELSALKKCPREREIIHLIIIYTYLKTHVPKKESNKILIHSTHNMHVKQFSKLRMKSKCPEFLIIILYDPFNISYFNLQVHVFIMLHN